MNALHARAAEVLDLARTRKVMLATGLMVGYGYTIEFWTGTHPVGGGRISKVGDGQTIASRATEDPDVVRHEHRRDGERVRVLVAGGRVTVNGEPVFLKGVNWHEESPERGRSLTPADYDAELAHLDALGANFLRNSHYNRHPYLYAAADEAGLLLLDEAENMWLDEPQQRVQLRSYGLSRALVAAMVWNQHNHPSVALWSLQNESQTSSGVYESWLADMRDAVRALDCQERPVTWASHTPTDPAFHLADVVGLNEYFGYFYGSDDMLGPVLDGLHGRHPDKPILVTENGTWSAPELRGGRPDPLTDPGTPEWQAAKFRAHWDQVTAPDRASYVTGFTFWSLRDYKTRRPYARFSYNGLSTMGLLPFDSDAETPVYAAFRDARPPT